MLVKTNKWTNNNKDSWSLYLGLNKHGHVYKHVMKLFNAGLQPQDVFMSGLDLIKGLTSYLRVGDDLKTKDIF